MKQKLWKQLSEELDNDIEDLFMRNKDYSSDIIKYRVSELLPPEGRSFL